MPFNYNVLWFIQTTPLTIVLLLEVCINSLNWDFVKADLGRYLLASFQSAVFTKRVLRGYVLPMVFNILVIKRPVPVYPRSLLVLSTSILINLRICALYGKSCSVKYQHWSAGINIDILLSRHSRDNHEVWPCLSRCLVPLRVVEITERMETRRTPM